MKRAMSLLIVAALSLSLMLCGSVASVSAEDAVVSTAPSSQSVEYLIGDIFEDGRITNRDLGLLQQYLNGYDVMVDEIKADVDGNGKVNNRDLGMMQQYLNGYDVEFVDPPVTPDPPFAADSLLDQVPDELSGTKIKMQLWWTPTAIDMAKQDEFYEQTGIQVTYETSTLDKYQSTLAGKILSGNPPALAAIINEWYPVPITRGLMQPIKNTGWDFSDPIYATNLMDQFSYKGEYYGIALKGSTMTTFEVMFFNKKVLKSFGVTQDPYQLWKAGKWNWETCLDIAKKCTNASKDKYGLTLISQYYWMLSAGQDFVLSDKAGLKNNIRSSALLDSWYHAWDMIYTHKVIPTYFYKQQELFYDGSVAMLGAGSYFMGTTSSNYVPQNMTDDEWGVVPFPSPKGQSPVAACEGAVWGFPANVTGNKLQAAAWYLRYYLDDYNCGDRNVYPNEQCWEVINWMYDQKIQSYNSVGVVSYGGVYNPWSVQYSLIDEPYTKAQVGSNLAEWYVVFDEQIHMIENELS